MPYFTKYKNLTYDIFQIENNLNEYLYNFFKKYYNLELNTTKYKNFTKKFLKKNKKNALQIKYFKKYDYEDWITYLQKYKTYPNYENILDNDLLLKLTEIYKDDLIYFNYNNTNMNSSYENILKNISSKLPKDFNVSLYKKINEDLNDLTDTLAKIHYVYNGINENREYKTNFHTLPKDFNVFVYKELNEDLQHFNNFKLKLHYINHGMNEERKYKIDNIEKLPKDFNPKIYKELNEDLCYMSDLQLKYHYVNFGIFENRNYFVDFSHLPEKFNSSNYIQLNYDLKNFTKLQAKLHYLFYGHKEKRVYKLDNTLLPKDFDVIVYKNINYDLKELSNTKLKIHYITNGVEEKRIYKKIFCKINKKTIFLSNYFYWKSILYKWKKIIVTFFNTLHFKYKKYYQNYFLHYFSFQQNKNYLKMKNIYNIRFLLNNCKTDFTHFFKNKNLLSHLNNNILKINYSFTLFLNNNHNNHNNHNYHNNHNNIFKPINNCDIFKPKNNIDIFKPKNNIDIFKRKNNSDIVKPKNNTDIFKKKNNLFRIFIFNNYLKTKIIEKSIYLLFKNENKNIIKRGKK
jgi:hypothetical protein